MHRWRSPGIAGYRHASLAIAGHRSLSPSIAGDRRKCLPGDKTLLRFPLPDIITNSLRSSGKETYDEARVPDDVRAVEITSLVVSQITSKVSWLGFGLGLGFTNTRLGRQTYRCERTADCARYLQEGI